MLKYKLKENSIQPNSSQPIKDYLMSLGIQKLESFLKAPTSEDELSPYDLDNMGTAINLLHEMFSSNEPIFLQVDCDVDGYTSAAIFYRYFKNIYPKANIIWDLHNDKEHGVMPEKVPAEVKYVVIPDAGSSQKEEQKTLIDRGCKILVLDHHVVQEHYDHPNLVIVNSQLGSFENRALSGGGVVFKTIQAYAETLDTITNWRDYYDLAALALISDMMDMRTLDNNYIVFQGLTHIKNKMLAALLNKQAYSIKDTKCPTKIDVAFYIAPLINAVIRIGSSEEKKLLFSAFTEEPLFDLAALQHPGENYYECAARICSNAHSRQNTQKERCYNYLRGKIDEQKLYQNKIIAVITSKDDKVPVPQTITGLIAMNLMKYYNKPVLVLRPKMENGTLYYCGSGRGKQAEGFDNFLQFTIESKLTHYGAGHNFAFGFGIEASKFDEFIKECNERLENVEFDVDFAAVDAIFTPNTINYDMLYQFAAYMSIYGNGIPQPKIAIEGEISRDRILIMGKDKASIRFNLGNNLSAVRFKDKATADLVNTAANYHFIAIGRTQLNEWGGNTSTQLIIDDIEITPIAAKTLF